MIEMPIKILVVDDDRETLKIYVKALLLWHNATEWNRKLPGAPTTQYLCQLRKAEGGLRGMNTTQAGDLVENLV